MLRSCALWRRAAQGLFIWLLAFATVPLQAQFNSTSAEAARRMRASGLVDSAPHESSSGISVGGCAGSIGNFIWIDTNADGLQSAGEDGLPFVQVRLYQLAGGSEDLLAQTVTNAGGAYVFAGLCAGVYVVEIVPSSVPAGLELTFSNVGGDDSVDSDFIVEGPVFRAPVVLSSDSDADGTIDAGFRGGATVDFGACCLPDGSCQFVASEIACLVLGGEFQGAFTECGGVTCPQFGACCFPDGVCLPASQVTCETAGGSYQGDGTACDPGICVIGGACCLTGDVCEVLPAEECTESGGEYQGDGTLCSPATCSPETGACCLFDGSCAETTERACLLTDGVYQGDGVLCAEIECPAPGACCLPNGSCLSRTQPECAALGGLYQGPLTSCANVVCTTACCLVNGQCELLTPAQCVASGGQVQNQLTCDGVVCQVLIGACCLPGGDCIRSLTSAQCTNLGGQYQGNGTECALVICTTACCLPDGSCVVVSAALCTAQGGNIESSLTCEGVSCPVLIGACCLPGGACIGGVTSEGCAAQGGLYQGNASSCALVSCPAGCCLVTGECVVLPPSDCAAQGGTVQPTLDCALVSCRILIGACCLPGGTCVDGETAEQCTAQSGVYQGNATMCQAVECTAACCLPTGACIVVEPEACLASGGVVEPALDCVGVSCPVLVGACCLSTGACQEGLTDEQCAAAAGAFQGQGSQCDQVVCTTACCLPDGSCIVASPAECAAQGGTPQNALTCDSIDCAVIIGACCLPGGACTDGLTSEECSAAAGQYQGNGTTCGTVACPSACCLPSGACVVVVVDACIAQGGVVQNALSCDQVACPQPLFACCLPDGSCDELTAADCLAQGGAPQPESACGNVNCPAPIGACCFLDGSCEALSESDCSAAGGLSWQEGSDCALDPCPQPGACCLPDGSCVISLEVGGADCIALGGTYAGDETTCGPSTCISDDRVSATEKGSLLVFSKVEVRWNGSGTLLQDTFIGLTNDHPSPVRVLMYFVNGDEPLEETPLERAHPGWNFIDNEITLTGNQPVAWSALNGSTAAGLLSPWTVLDPGTPPGRPADDGSGERVLRGMIYAWAVDESGAEVAWNHLAGSATVVNYAHGHAWEYNAFAFQSVADVPVGAPTGTPGHLMLDGMEFARPCSQLLVNFQAVGSSALSQDAIVISATALTIHPVSADFRLNTPGTTAVTTRAVFDIWNENEVKFSGTSRCVTCWSEALLNQYDVPNHFLLQHLQSDFGKARIDGLASVQCVGVDRLGNPVPSRADAMLGVAVRILSFDNQSSENPGAAGDDLTGMGFQSADVRFDPVGEPPEAPQRGGTKR